MVGFRMEESSSLIENIRRLIDKSDSKKIPFQTFMAIALYDKNDGYYMKHRSKIGKEGDFYTNSSVGDIYGTVIANQMIEMIEHVIQIDGQINLVEFGGGNGSLAQQILQELSRYPHIYSSISIFMIESSDYHRALQKKSLENHLDRVTWVSTLAEIQSMDNINRAIIYSNELIDAFPVHRIRYHDGVLEEMYVGWDEKKTAFFTTYSPLSSMELESYLISRNIELEEGQEAEVNLKALNWMEEVGQWLNEGYVITIDYGFERKELYAPYRKSGTIMSYYKHTNNTSPIEHVGEQDITSHIDFTTLMEIGEKHGLEKIAYMPQSHFLLHCGILSYLKDSFGEDPFTSPIVKRNRAIRQLIQPGGMGDAFSVLIQQKGIGNVPLMCLHKPSEFLV